MPSQRQEEADLDMGIGTTPLGSGGQTLHDWMAMNWPTSATWDGL